MKKTTWILLIVLNCCILFGVTGCGTKTNISTDTSTNISTNTSLTSKTDSTSSSTSINTNIVQNGNGNTSGNINDKSNQNLITIEEAQSVVEKFCRKPNIGAEGFYNQKKDTEVNGDKYYYFDVIYGMQMGDKPKAEDNVISRVFVNSKDKSLYEVIEGSDKKLSVGKRLTKN